MEHTAFSLPMLITPYALIDKLSPGFARRKEVERTYIGTYLALKTHDFLPDRQITTKIKKKKSILLTTLTNPPRHKPSNYTIPINQIIPIPTKPYHPSKSNHQLPNPLPFLQCQPPTPHAAKPPIQQDSPPSHSYPPLLTLLLLTKKTSHTTDKNLSNLSPSPAPAPESAATPKSPTSEHLQPPQILARRRASQPTALERLSISREVRRSGTRTRTTTMGYGRGKFGSWRGEGLFGFGEESIVKSDEGGN